MKKPVRNFRVWAGVGIILCLLASLPVIYHLSVHARHDRRAAELNEELTQRLRAYQEDFAFERPVLRGEPIEGDSWELSEMAFLSMGPISDANPERDAEAQRETLQLLRDALQAEVSRPEDPFLHEDIYTPVSAARQAMVVLARTSSPGECLVLAADAVRLWQDTYLSCGGDLPEGISEVVTRCAQEATPEQRQSAAAEFAVLAEHWPGQAARNEAGALFDAQEASNKFHQKPWFALSGRGRLLIDQQERTLHEFEQALRGSNGSEREQIRWDEDTTRLATVRLIALMLAVLSDVDPAVGFSQDVPTVLENPELKDPWSYGRSPFHWQTSDPRHAQISSAGPRGRAGQPSISFSLEQELDSPDSTAR